jgi:hypothetical protein
MTGSTTDAMLRSLHAPTRNKYYYGKLLDVRALQMEQCYGLDKRWLLNRLALGSGVLCGLTVTAGADGISCISPGVAIDALGREIIVPAPVAVPPQLTDSRGVATGDPLTDGQITIYLCYTECDADLTSVAIADCDGATSAAAGTTVERYRIVVQAGLPGAEPAELTGSQRDAIFPTQPPNGFDRRIAAEQSLAVTCTDPPDATCVVLATVTLAGQGQPPTVDQFTYRAEVFSNTVLFELIAALADRVDACCASIHQSEQAISIVDGDAQTAEVATVLPAPVHLLVADSNGNAVTAAAVDLSTTDPDAALSLDGIAFDQTVSGVTDGSGVLTVQWRLGTAAGAQSFSAKLPADGATVTAHATATAVPAGPPVVERTEPVNGAQVATDWANQPQLTVTFDQAMDPQGLAKPDDWLRAWMFPINVDGQFSQGQRLKLAPGDPGEGSTSTFRAEPFEANRFVVVVMMRGSSPEIAAANSGLALDAEFAGTKLSQKQLDVLWATDSFQPTKAFMAAVRDGGGTLPSGDGTPGGKYFHGFLTGSPA